GPARIDASDLRFTGISGVPSSDPVCGNASVKCSGMGVLLRARSELRPVALVMERFSFTEIASTGIDVGVGTGIDLSSGVVAAPTGMVYGTTGDWRDHTLEVSFDARTYVEMTPPMRSLARPMTRSLKRVALRRPRSSR
ncbi:MAG: hypothetical protein ACKVXR_18915, partial [Planctomycetota bacterium]